ncbi:hypothetical protein CPB84DRAFT_1799079 [Gymnopilus junonius]|uniref:F-box domain-containing protein n=1 Tax=Gymnopilus junonius TaxID=109634 RepID=A0A9P5TF20_GYMJU|nr:hypothetical protein CPB84DRAFT_1799079 [Gymnopilus junonius]
MHHNMPLIALPQEILIYILSHLDYRSLLSCGSTCRLLYTILKGSDELGCIIELDIDGFMTPFTSLSYSELISRLRGLRRSWAELDCKHFEKVELNIQDIAYKLGAGLFAISDKRSLLFTWLPSSTIPGRTLKYPSLGFLIRDFAIDPTQDLVVILEYDPSPIAFTDARHVRLHIRTISTIEVHPAASHGILEFDIPSDETFGTSISTILVEIAIDIVALYITKDFYSGLSRVLIWNWQTGILIYDSDIIGDPLPRTVHHFTLLTRDSFILALTHGGGAMQIYTFFPTSKALSVPSLCATLHLPCIYPPPRCALTLLILNSGLVTESANQSETTTLTYAPKAHVIMLTLFYSIMQADDGQEMRSESYTLFVRKQTLLEYVDRFRQREALELDEVKEVQNTDSDVDWDSWGERNTRLIQTQSLNRHTHGARVIFSRRGEPMIEVLNFNIPSCTSVSTSASTSAFEFHDAPTTGYPNYLFQNDFMTCLPYYSTVRVLEESFFTFMIDEERVIGIKTSNTFDINLHVCPV